MLRKGKNFFLLIHQILDLAIVTFCFYLAYETKLNLPGEIGGLTLDFSYKNLLLLSLISYHISLRLFGAYEQLRKIKFTRIIFNIFKATTSATVGAIFLGYLLHFESVSRILLLSFFAYSFLGLSLFRGAVYKILAVSRRNNYNIRWILVIGSRQRAQEFIKAVSKKRESGYRILGCLEQNDHKELIRDRIYKSVKIIGTMDNFKSVLQENTVDEIVFAIPLKELEHAENFIHIAEEMGKSVRILPDFQIDRINYFPQTAKIEIEDFIGVTTLSLSSGPQNQNKLLMKSFIDYLGALAGIIFFSPVLLLICLTIKFTSKGPVLFSQERMGKNGRRFKLLKFRTMVAEAEQLQGTLIKENEMDGPVFKLKKDPRVTTIGSFLRRTSLDELPQLFNVIKGEMSLVGPRPPIPREVEEYEVWQRRRLSMKPGLTCIWQVSGRNEVSFEKWMNMDLEYIDNWSLMMDLKLLILTVKEVIAWSGR
ncbi:sugar transferase [Thermodesulfobacteriota bacterium]